MKSETTLNPSESLNIISEMVEQARFNFSKNSFYFIMWGTLLTVASAFQLMAANMELTEYFWIGWPIAGFTGGIISAVVSQKIAADLGHQSHIDKMYGMIWIIYFITLVLMLAALVSNGFQPSGYVMILTGLPTVLTGKLIKFNPLVIGGVSFWVLGFVAIFLFPELGDALFITSMITGYLIPGFMMRAIKQ
jgi:hypothetical protein